LPESDVQDPNRSLFALTTTPPTNPTRAYLQVQVLQQAWHGPGHACNASKPHSKPFHKVRGLRLQLQLAVLVVLLQ
jgi:hypothetical protein